MLREFRWSYAGRGCIDLTKIADDGIAPFLQDLYDKASSLYMYEEEVLQTWTVLACAAYY